jgi:hypothetical protein
MIDPVKFQTLAENAKEAEACRADVEEKFLRLKQWLEAAARHASQTQGELRRYVEIEAGLKLK